MRQKVAKIDEIHESNKNNKQFCHVGHQIEDCKLGLFQDALLQVTCGILHQRQEVAVRIGITHVCVHFVGVPGANRFLTAVPSMKLYRLTQVYVWMVYQLYNWECVCWEHFPAKKPRETLSVRNAIGSFRLIQILNIVYVSPLTMFRPTFPSALDQPNFTSTKTMRQ